MGQFQAAAALRERLALRPGDLSLTAVILTSPAPYGPANPDLLTPLIYDVIVPGVAAGQR